MNKNIGAGLTAGELAMLAGAKVLTERATLKYIGNANFKSGGIKLIVAGVGAFVVQNRLARFALAGVALDGFEDVIEAGSKKAGFEEETEFLGMVV